MDIITKSALEFNKLLSTKYHFVVSKKRVTRNISLGFASTDFYHIAGLQYLSDVDIKRNRGDTISLVINGRITDSLLQKSRFYYGKDGEERSVFNRIEELRNLRQYIESDNYISIFELRESRTGSCIDAEYVINSRLRGGIKEVFIFLRKREENEEYGIVSFFVKGKRDYRGEKLYWMLKERIEEDGSRIILYKHPTFTITQ